MKNKRARRVHGENSSLRKNTARIPNEGVLRLKKSTLVLLLAVLLCLPFSSVAQERQYAQFFGSGSRDENRVAVTIDDWWEPGLIPDFLAVAEQYGVRLTLYPCGCNLHETDRELWQSALDAGHEIGSHGFSHQDFSERGSLLIARDFEKFGNALDKTLGYHYEFLTVRVPYGGGWRQGGSGHVGRSCHEAGFDYVIFWDMDDTKDLNKALNTIQNGSIILLHANRHDLKFFSELMEGLKDREYEYVTVSELLGITTRLIPEEDEAAIPAAGAA